MRGLLCPVVGHFMHVYPVVYSATEHALGEGKTGTFLKKLRPSFEKTDHNKFFKRKT